MTITPELFSKLVFKEDLKLALEDLEKRLPSKKQVEKLQKTMDSITKEYKKIT